MNFSENPHPKVLPQREDKAQNPKENDGAQKNQKIKYASWWITL